MSIEVRARSRRERVGACALVAVAGAAGRAAAPGAPEGFVPSLVRGRASSSCSALAFALPARALRRVGRPGRGPGLVGARTSGRSMPGGALVAAAALRRRPRGRRPARVRAAADGRRRRTWSLLWVAAGRLVWLAALVVWVVARAYSGARRRPTSFWLAGPGGRARRRGGGRRRGAARATWGDERVAAGRLDHEAYVELVLRCVEQVPARPGHDVRRDRGGRRPGRRRRRATAGRVGDGAHGGPVPWWRVVRADGSLPPSHQDEARQTYLEEGTPLRPLGNVDLRQAFWRPPAPG